MSHSQNLGRDERGTDLPADGLGPDSATYEKGSLSTPILLSNESSFSVSSVIT